MSMQTNGQQRMPVPQHTSRPKESDRTTRRPMVFWDRVKVLFLLLVSFGVLVWSDNSNVPIKAVRDSLRDVAHDYWWLLALAGLEVLRQVHYLIEEHSPAYYGFWNNLFGRWHKRLERTNDFTRFRLGRVVKLLIFLFVLDKLLAAIFHVPEPALVSLPALIVRGLPMIFQVIFIMFVAVGQFVAIFWFLSRGGIDTYMPDDLETRFSDVKGQDPVLERVQENMIFLEDPESIEERGGYVPGGSAAVGSPGDREDADRAGGRGRDRQAVRVRGSRGVHPDVHGRGHPQGEEPVSEAPQARRPLRRGDRLLRRGRLVRQSRIARRTRRWMELRSRHGLGARSRMQRVRVRRPASTRDDASSARRWRASTDADLHGRWAAAAGWARCRRCCRRCRG